jgi:hypothetical protein
MVKESGLTGIPAEVQATLVKGEYALKTRTAGTWGVVATNRRVFVREGLISRKVTELRYADIKSIEHSRRYPWRTLLTGWAISAFLLVLPSLRPIFSHAFIAEVESLVQYVARSTPPWLTSNMIVQVILPILPVSISVVMFLLGARLGFNLYGLGIKPLFLPGRFKDIIGFIRDRIDSSMT